MCRAKRLAMAVALMVAATSAITTSAQAGPLFQPVLDEFWVVKNGTEIFRDPFSDGVPPPSGPDDAVAPGGNTYNLFGPGGITGESVGRLTMTPVNGDPVLITAAFADISTVGTRILATNPASPDFLGQPASFEIHGTYDMSAVPAITGQSFGIRATDRAPLLPTPNEGNNTIQLIVAKQSGTGDIVVLVQLADFELNTLTPIAFYPIDALLPSAAQIELVLSKTAGEDNLDASFTLYDAAHTIIGQADDSAFTSVMGNSLDLDQNRIYQGEGFIRAAFFATDRVPIPEPAGLALFALGVAAMELMRRRRPAR